MLCRTARRSVIQEAAGLLGANDRAALKRHLEQCARCSDEAALERRITRDLGVLRQETSLDVDVRDRVVARLSALPPIDRVEVPTWQLGSAAALATAGVVGLLTALWLLGAQMSSTTMQTFRVLTSLADAALSAVGVFAGLLLIPLRVGLSLLAALPELLTRVEPVAIGSIAVGYAIATVFVVYILGRDLRATGARPE